MNGDFGIGDFDHLPHIHIALLGNWIFHLQFQGYIIINFKKEKKLLTCSTFGGEVGLQGYHINRSECFLMQDSYSKGQCWIVIKRFE